MTSWWETNKVYLTKCYSFNSLLRPLLHRQVCYVPAINATRAIIFLLEHFQELLERMLTTFKGTWSQLVIKNNGFLCAIELPFTWLCPVEVSFTGITSLSCCCQRSKECIEAPHCVYSNHCCSLCLSVLLQVVFSLTIPSTSHGPSLLLSFTWVPRISSLTSRGSRLFWILTLTCRA